MVQKGTRSADFEGCFDGVDSGGGFEKRASDGPLIAAL
jgi:hypothetical protein